MFFKRFFGFLLLFTFIFAFVQKSSVKSVVVDDAIYNLNITSPVVLLMESETGTVLYDKKGYEKMYPASTTKIMTAILTLENCDLNDVAIVSRSALLSVPPDYTNANLQVDEELTIKDLIYTFMVRSANDCGYVLAEHIAGSTENFADMMNLKATEIGCKNTHFTNPSGIHDENHYTTAYDLALIGRYAMKNEIFRDIVSTASCNLPASNKYDSDDRKFVNTNYMIRESQTRYYYEFATGIKTGFTDEARDCVVASAKKDGLEYICVVLYAGYTQDTWLKEKFIDCVTLFNYAFENYTTKKLGNQGFVYNNINVSGATKDTQNLDLVLEDDIDVFISNSQVDDNFEPSVNIKENITAPISKGEVLGSISYTVNDITYSSNLVANSDVQKFDFSPTIFKVFIVFILLFIIFKIFKFYIHYKKYKHRNYRKGKKKKYKR